MNYEEFIRKIQSDMFNYFNERQAGLLGATAMTLVITCDEWNKFWDSKVDEINNGDTNEKI